MEQITINPNNEPYYSEDFIKGFKCGAERQFEADISDADRPQGEWIDRSDGGRILHPWWESCECNQCKEWGSGAWNFCPHCGARMKGADDETTTV